jgi:3-dehydroquinate dehydratase-2
MTILIINGPNLNLLGKREPHIYGDQSFDAYFEKLQGEFSDTTLEYKQSNIEGELINYLQSLKGIDGVILNAGGYTHTSVALADAIATVNVPVIEVHISYPAAREPYRHTSLMARYVKGSIAGFGLESYKLAIISLLNLKI